MRQVKTLSHLQYSEQLLTYQRGLLNFRGRYLAVDYLLAELLLRTYGANRQRLLHQASELLENFLTRLDSYELLSNQNKQLLDQYQEDRKTFHLASVADAAERRRIKVMRFQEEKGLKAKLEVHECFQLQAWILTSEQLLRTESGQSSVDEEVLRRLYFTELELFASP